MSDITPPYAIVLDDHPLVGRGMAHYLQGVRPDLVVRVAQSWLEGDALLQAHGCPRALVVDIWLPEGNSLSHLARLRDACPGMVWLAISGDDDPQVAQRARTAGAQGFVHKQGAPETFAKAFDAVLSGGLWFEGAGPAVPSASPVREWEVSASDLGLTQRQGEILALVLRGLSNKRIAMLLDITENTVKEHLTGILERLGVRNRVEAITAMRGRRLTLRSAA
jgi:DNA-binding NarL/FixJ family response regulator